MRQRIAVGLLYAVLIALACVYEQAMSPTTDHEPPPEPYPRCRYLRDGSKEETRPIATTPKHCGKPMEKRTNGEVIVYRCRCGTAPAAPRHRAGPTAGPTETGQCSRSRGGSIFPG
jgi:hypothetical protein